MKSFYIFAIYCTLVAVIAAEDDIKPKPNTTERTTTTTTTTPASTTSTSSSTSSSTTTPSTSSTTSSTSTTTSSTSTVTPAPITTSTAAPPLPSPEIGEWNSTCIKLKLAAQLSFSYNTTDNKTKKAIYNLPVKEINADAECKFNETQSIVLHWMHNETKEENSVKFTFDKDDKTYRLSMIHIKLQPNHFYPDANNDSVQLIYANNQTFVSPLGMSYHCTRKQAFDLIEVLSSKNITGNITLSNAQIEAFHKDVKHSSDWSFSSAKDCDGNNTPDIVPIAVGIALTALILIVLISYLVARRRNSIRGYMSF